MLSILTAAMLLQTEAISPPAGAMCVQSKWGEDYVYYVVPATKVGELTGKADSKGRQFEVTPCKVRWTAAQTKALCDAVSDYNDDRKSAMTAIYGITPDEMCESAKEVDALQNG